MIKTKDSVALALSRVVWLVFVFKARAHVVGVSSFRTRNTPSSTLSFVPTQTTSSSQIAKAKPKLDEKTGNKMSLFDKSRVSRREKEKTAR